MRARALVRALTGALAGFSMAGASAQLFGVGSPIEPPRVLPGVRASATYSDNVGHEPDGREDSDLILEVSPYISATSNNPRASYNVFYQMRNFLRVGESDLTLFRHALNGNGSFALVDDRLWIDASAFMGTINASPTGALSTDPGSAFSNTANVRHFSVSPWYQDAFGRIATYQLRYTLAHTGGNSDFATARVSHTASAEVNGIPTGSPWNWRWYGNMQRREFDNNLDRDRRASGAALYYTVNPELRVYGAIDYEQIDGLVNENGDDFGYGPGAGFDWTPSQRTTVSGSISDRYYGTVGNLNASHTLHNSTFGLRYSRSVLTSADASLLLFDPRSITSGGFGFGGTNPVLGSLISSGIVLPPGTVFTQGLFTDAAVLDRRVTAFWGLRGARNSLTLTGWASNRESTTELGATTAIVGIRGTSTIGGVFSGEIRERGYAANLQHRLDGRSSFTVALDRRRTHSPTAGFESQLTTMRVSYQTWLTSDMAGFAGVRRTIQSGNGLSARYDENAIYGGVDMRFY